MILMDMNQVIIAATMAAMGNHRNVEIDPQVVKHIALNSIRANHSQFKGEFGELVICADDRNYWRKKEFPYYKATRKDEQKKSEINWSAIFNTLNEIRDDLIDFFPYRVIRVAQAEADDVIATIVHKEGRILASEDAEPILILSGDKDFKQLHIYANVKQYSPAEKKWVVCSDPEGYLKEHIIRGDRSDGIPNIMMDNDCLIRKVRQKPVTAKRLDNWLDGNFTDSERVNYIRNEKLIDLSKVPDTLKKAILDIYETPYDQDRSKIYKYLVNNRMSSLLEHLNEF